MSATPRSATACPPRTAPRLGRAARLALLLALVAPLGGCVLTKVVTVPMRVVGAVVSIVPVVGNTADAAIDSAADAVDEVPL